MGMWTNKRPYFELEINGVYIMVSHDDVKIAHEVGVKIQELLNKEYGEKDAGKKDSN